MLRSAIGLEFETMSADEGSSDDEKDATTKSDKSDKTDKTASSTEHSELPTGLDRLNTTDSIFYRESHDPDNYPKSLLDGYMRWV